MAIDKINLGSQELLPISDIHHQQRVRHVERQVSSHPHAASSHHRFAEDEFLTQSIHHQSFKGHTLSLGMVTYSFPYCRWYKVRLDIGGSVLRCCTLSSLGPRLGGVRETHQIPPNTMVLVYCPIELDHGIILGCIPTRGDGSPGFADMHCQGDAAGGYREKYYNTIAERFARNGDVINFGANSPVDSLSVGEWGVMNDLGGGLFLDPMMSYIRADETSGLWLFHQDRLTRLGGYNYDFRSCMSEEVIRNDEGEGFYYQGFTPYIWEALGALKPGTDPWDLKEDDKALLETDLRAHGEPKSQDQLPVYRLEEYRGYVGQAYFRQVSLPSLNGSNHLKTIANSSSPEARGVFREQLGLDGSWAVMSAHSIHIGKRGLLLDARRLRTNEDPEGDDLANETGITKYRPAGYYGGRTTKNEHRLTDAIRPPEATNSQWGAATLIDALAYAINWKGFHPFTYHLKDYAKQDIGPIVEARPNYGQLIKQQWLTLPKPGEVEIDHRYKALLYNLSSSISFNSDGSMSLRGGQGCEIRFAGGTATISAPGDIMVQSGRSTINYAGDDAIIRAYNSVDVSANNHDVHIKAQKNLELLGGNSGHGRVLIESRSSGGAQNIHVLGKQGEDIEQGGLFIKSASDLVSYAAYNSYIRTDVGQITIDAGSGHQAIRTYAGSFINHLTEQFLVSFVGSDADQPVTHSLGEGRVQFSTPVIVGGSMFIQSNVSVRGSVAAVGGEVGPIRAGDRGFELANSYHTERDTEIQKASSDAASDFEAGIQETWYAESSIGTTNILAAVQYSPRNDKQLGTVGFKLPETYYQQLIGNNFGNFTWTENTITYQGTAMMPHPGLKTWQTEDALLRVQPKLYDISQGKETSPLASKGYAEAVAGEFTAAKLEEQYSIFPNQS